MEEETRQVIFETNGKTYKELYDNIIEENLRNPPPEGENTIEHHIRPKSIFPDLRYSKENLVRLTEKSHLKAHYLLWQHYKRETDDRDSERKMCTAFWNMVHEIEWRGDTELGWIADKYEELRVDFRKRMSDEMKEVMNRPDMRAKMSKATKEAWKRPEVRAKMSEVIKEAWKRPEVRAKMSEVIKEALKNPEVRAKFSDAKKGDKNPMRLYPDKNPMKNPEVRVKFFKKVIQYSLDGTFITEYPSLTEAAIKTNSLKGCISLCCTGKRKTHNGFVWKYAESK